MTKSSSATVLKMYEDNPEPGKIDRIANALKEGSVVIYPTDTVYGLGCDLYNTKAIDRITRIKSFSSIKPIFTIICEDISQVSQYTKVIGNEVFKMMKRVLPGPYTFILEANNKIPKAINQKRKTIGVRVPDNNITLAIVKALGNPIITTSIKFDDDVVEYYTDPDDIVDAYERLVDYIVDGGMGGNSPSTMVDCSGDEIEIIREGAGNLDNLF